MTELKRYRIHYRINGEPASITLDSFEEPGLGQIELEILLHHVREPGAVVDAPWESPCHPSERSSIAELGVSDIQLEEERR